MKNNVKLYNVMFPIWFFFFYPTFLWLIILPVNFVIDSLVVYFCVKKQAVADFKPLYKKSILKVWFFGFLADFLGGFVCLLTMDLFTRFLPRIETVLFPGSFIPSIPGVLVAGVLIYVLNRFVSFRKTNLTKQQIHYFSLMLAIFTAPYTMLIPIYG